MATAPARPPINRPPRPGVVSASIRDPEAARRSARPSRPPPARLPTTQPRCSRRIRRGQQVRLRSIPTIEERTSSRGRLASRAVKGVAYLSLSSSAVPPAATRAARLNAGTPFVCVRWSQTACPSPRRTSREVGDAYFPPSLSGGLATPCLAGSAPIVRLKIPPRWRRQWNAGRCPDLGRLGHLQATQSVWPW